MAEKRLKLANKGVSGLDEAVKVLWTENLSPTMSAGATHARPKPDVSLMANRSLSSMSSLVGYSGKSSVLKLAKTSHAHRE